MRLKQWLAGVALSLVGWLLKHEENKAMGSSVTIGGVTFPVSDIEAALAELPKIRAGVKSGLKPSDIVKLIVPAVLPTIETIANVLFPGAGTGIGFFDYIIEHSHPATPEEQKRQEDKADGAAIRDAAGGKSDGW